VIGTEADAYFRKPLEVKDFNIAGEVVNQHPPVIQSQNLRYFRGKSVNIQEDRKLNYYLLLDHR
jgi:hypothetical protein